MLRVEMEELSHIANPVAGIPTDSWKEMDTKNSNVTLLNLCF